MVGRVKVRVGLRPSCLMADVATWKRMSLKVAVRLRIAAAPLVVLGIILPRASTNAAADVMVMVCPAIVPGSRGGVGVAVETHVQKQIRVRISI